MGGYSTVEVGKMRFSILLIAQTEKITDMQFNKLSSFFIALIVVLAVFMLNMTFAGIMPANVMMISRVVLIFLFFIIWRLYRRKKQTNVKNMAFILMVINLAFFVVSFFTAVFWDLNLQSPKGIALAKLNDGFIISLVLILSFLFGGFKLKDIFIAKGKLSLGLITGIITFSIMGFLALNNPQNPINSEFLVKNIFWILLFIFANAFMEELLFRGIFIKQLNNFLKPVWTIILTAVVFAAAHLQVTYTEDVLFFSAIVLILGLIWGFLMHYTKSIIASVLFHAGADLMIIIPVYSSFGVSV